MEARADLSEARAEVSRLLVSKVNQQVSDKASKPTPKPKRAYTYKASTTQRQTARKERDSYRAALNRSVRVPDSVLKPASRSEYDATVFTGNSNDSARRERLIDDIVNGNGDTPEEDSNSNPGSNSDSNPNKWVM
jgi:hypothetical protein